MKRIFFPIFCFTLLSLNIKGVTLDSWPRHIRIQSGIMTVYQPQLDGLDGNVLMGRAAVAFKANENAEPIFGAVWLKGTVEIDRNENLVHYTTLEITETRFPEGSGKVGEEFQAAIQEGMKTWELDTTLDALKTSLAASDVSQKAEDSYKNDPPEIITRNHPALLINIDGKTRLREIEGTAYQSVENTPYPLIFDPGNNAYYLNAAEGVWYQARSEDGPWTFLQNPPGEMVQLVESQKPSTDSKSDADKITPENAPEIIVSHKPTELVVTDGEAEFQPLIDNLLVIKNSETPVFMEVDAQAYFLNLSGRWYQSSSMAGTWTYIDSNELPEVFSSIPADSSFADIRAYVAGTDEAHEAVMDAHIPQTAAVQRGPADIKVLYDGKAKFEKVDGTDLTFAVNASETVIHDGQSYYLVKDGVWYLSEQADGPWQVSDKAPPGIAGVQPSSPVYNTKYVYIYDATPEVVYVGYTPGYLCSYVVGPTVVYGTGWYYNPWYGPRYYYPRHATWGFSFRYNPVTGWGVGMSWSSGPFRVSWYSGGGWHGHPWYGPGVWGPGRYRPSHHSNLHINNSININQNNISNNLYARKDQAVNIQKPTPNRPQRPQTLPADMGNLKDNNVFTDKEGNIFKNENGKWQSHENGKWQDTDFSKPAARPEVTKPATRPAAVPDNRPQIEERPQFDKRPPSLPETAKPNLPATRPATRPEISKPTLPSTMPASHTNTRPARSSGYSNTNAMQRQSHARSRASAAGAARGRAR